MPAAACINTFSMKLMDLKREGKEPELVQAAERAELTYRQSPSLENANDLAVAWILTGDGSKGIELLREIESKPPRSAKVAANLGTALELAGENEEALKWIRESVRRDPNEHQGSEWVHVKILEAKLAIAKDPDWLVDHSVMGWTPDKPLRDNAGKLRRVGVLMEQIRYQLRERVIFFDPPDAIVGDLFVTLGDIGMANNETLETPFHYRKALKYGTVHEVRIRPLVYALDKRFEDERARVESARQRAIEVAAKNRADQLSMRWRVAWIFGGLAVIAAAIFIYRRFVKKP